MTQIRIDTERAGEVARRLITKADRMAEIGRELQNAIGSLDTGDWDGRSRARAEPLLGRVRPESEWVKHQLEELGYKLVRVANIFEQEDDTAARNLEGMGWVEWDTDQNITGIATGIAGGIVAGAVGSAAGATAHSGTSASNIAKFLKWDYETSKRIIEFKNTAADVVKVKGLEIFKGYTYPKQIILRGSHEVKEIAGLDPHLTHIKLSTTLISKQAGNMGLDAFKDGLNFNLKKNPCNLIDVALNGYENWEEYGDESLSKFAVGTVVDSVMDIGLSAIGAGIGTWGGAALGGVILGAVSCGTLAPVGAAIGGKIGGFLGSWAMDKWVSEPLQETEAHDKVVDWTADRIDDTTKAISDTAGAVSEGIRQQAKEVDQALDSAASSLVDLF